MRAGGSRDDPDGSHDHPSATGHGTTDAKCKISVIFLMSADFVKITADFVKMTVKFRKMTADFRKMTTHF